MFVGRASRSTAAAALNTRVRFAAIRSCYLSSCKKMKVPALIQPEEAMELLNKPTVRFVDGSWHMDKSRDPIKEWIDERIPGAAHFCIDEVSDKSSDLPHMLPSAELFGEAMDRKRIRPSDHVVVYGTRGCVSAARVWWTFKVFGHEQVSILDGGLEAWKDAGGAVAEGGEPQNAPPSPAGADGAAKRVRYTALKEDAFVADKEAVLQAVNTGIAQIADARSLGRFSGEVAEPRAGLRGGHIPGSLCIPYALLVDEKNPAKFRPLTEVRDRLMDAGVILGSKTILTCGSGVTASVLAFCLHALGQQNLSMLPVYDGSWTEWGAAANSHLPIVGPEEKK